MVSKESFGVSVLFPFSFDAWQTEIQSTFIFFFFFITYFQLQEGQKARMKQKVM